ncbi:MAG: hypothetical protein JST30_07750 [Armatimonadetes bacterium]|nr:hypothetical protein [Armatimonadota bacterium]
MKLGFVALGKLGLPCALAMEHYGGHRVFGTDTSKEVLGYVRTRHIPYREEQAQGLLDESSLELCSTDELFDQCDLIFLAVQTPHGPEYEGVTPLPPMRAHFDYQYIKAAAADLSAAADRLARDREPGPRLNGATRDDQSGDQAPTIVQSAILLQSVFHSDGHDHPGSYGSGVRPLGVGRS